METSYPSITKATHEKSFTNSLGETITLENLTKANITITSIAFTCLVKSEKNQLQGLLRRKKKAQQERKITITDSWIQFNHKEGSECAMVRFFSKEEYEKIPIDYDEDTLSKSKSESGLFPFEVSFCVEKILNFEWVKKENKS